MKNRNENTKELLAQRMRTRFYTALKGKSKVGSAIGDLGCSMNEFKLYIKNQFAPGMTWENYGDWHLDHVIPLASFDLTNRTELLEAMNWLNYQPLWAIDNLRKSCYAQK